MNRARALRELSLCLKGAPPDNLHWSEVVALANETFVTGELNAATPGGLSKRAPSEIMGFLTEVEQRTMQRNRSLQATLCASAHALNAIGIEPLLLKAAALWADDEAACLRARLTADIDLIVPETRFDAALLALQGANFRLLDDQRSDPRHAVAVLGRDGDAGALDVHKRPPGRAQHLYVDALATQSRRVHFCGVQVRIPPAHLHILMLIMHDQILDAGFWRGALNLRHLLDIAWITRRSRPVDWRAFWLLVKRAHISNAASAQLLAAQDIAGAVVPDHVMTSRRARFHYTRQTLQFLHPKVNQALKPLGLNALAWHFLSIQRFRAH